MLTILQAMAKEEGWGVPGARPTLNLNPLNLMYGPEAIEFGAIDNQDGMSMFPDAATGMTAARRWLSVPAKWGYDAILAVCTGGIIRYAHEPVPGRKLIGGYLGATLAEVIYRFAPPKQNNSAEYLITVCQLTGMLPSTILSESNLG